MRDIPTRIAIGTQKAASTYLYNLLASHPNVSLSEHTEIHFYSSHFEKGPQWYTDSFSADGVMIDISPKYFMYGEKVTPRIKETLGDTSPKLLLILRNPIDYLNSHFSMQYQQGFFTNNPTYPNPSKNLIEFIERYPVYRERALYHKTLSEHWLPVFPLDTFKIVFFEELVDPKTSEQIIADIQAFWGLPIHRLTAPTTSKNRALRSPFLHKVKNIIMRHLWLKEYLKKAKWFNFTYQHLLTDQSKNKLPVSDRRILRDMFREDVKKLERVLGRSVPWDDFRDNS